MSEYVDVDIIENGKVIGTFKCRHVTEEKTEKINEMKNRISMALKDPILQQGFEIICKNLTEQENQIADIKANCDLAIEGRDVKIKELEQENTELKEKLKPENCLKLLAKEGYIKFTSDQLTKAKEIIKELIDLGKIWLSEEEDDYSFIEQAEQFLKGENIILEDAQASNSPFDADEVFNKEMKAYPEGKVK